MRQGPQAALLEDGARLHLHHGPIDLIIGAEGDRATAFAAARECFDGVLEGLAAELPGLRAELGPATPPPTGRVARRMHAATRPHCGTVYVTRMAAVAGAVADEVLGAMVAQAVLNRAYVNNGGDIAVHLTPGERFGIAMAGVDGADHGRVRLTHGDAVGGIATSGAGGRSLSRGIADSVTVLAASAAAADVAATLIANAVDLPGHPAIRRQPARTLDPDSDLGARLVTTHVGALSPAEAQTAVEAGARVAETMRQSGLIAGAALFLRGARAVVGDGVAVIALPSPAPASIRGLFDEGASLREAPDHVRGRDHQRKA